MAALPSNQHSNNAVEMPRPTVWPVVLGLGILLAALGAPSRICSSALSVAFLLLIALLGWISQLLPGRGHEHEPLPAPEDRVTVTPRPAGAVEQLEPGKTGYRFQLPQKVHPLSAGIKGGILGGLLMPIPALIWAVSAGPQHLVSSKSLSWLSTARPHRYAGRSIARQPGNVFIRGDSYAPSLCTLCFRSASA